MKSMKVFGLTFFTSLVVLFSAGAIFLLIPSKAAGNEPTTSSEESYYPKSEENLSLLLIGEDRETGDALFFTLARFDAKNSMLTLSGLPLQTQISLGTRTDTLAGYYQKGGGVQALRALKQALRVSIDRFAVFTENSLITLADSLQGVEFNVPEDLQNEQVDIRRGMQQIDGRRFRDLVLYDETFQLDLQLVKALIDQKFTAALAGQGRALFSKIANTLETNLSSYDYEMRTEALLHWVKQENKSQIFEFQGTYQEDSTAFMLSEASIDSYRSQIYHLPEKSQ